MLLGNTWYYDCFPEEWRKRKHWGRKGGWALTLTVRKAIPAQAELSQRPQPPREHPGSQLGTAAPTATAQRQLAETALNRAPAPCSHLSGQHHPGLMWSIWKSFMVRQLLTGLSWETQPVASLWSACRHLGAGVVLAAVPSIHRAAQGWVISRLWNIMTGAVKPKKGLGVREGTQGMSSSVHSGGGFAAAATSNNSYCIHASLWEVTWASAIVLHPHMASGYPKLPS